VLIFKSEFLTEGCVQGASGVCGPLSAILFSAASSIGGNALPLFPARRKMPLHAFAER
jgi:hypothetical protein